MRTRVLIVLVVLMAAAVGVAATNRPERPTLRRAFADFPTEIGEWRGIQQEQFSAEVLKILGTDDYMVRAYSLPDRNGAYLLRDRPAVGLYIGYWASQRQGDTIHSPLNCLPGAGFEPVSQSMVTLPVPGDDSAKGPLANRYVVEKGLERQYVLYWYQSHGRVVASEYWSKFFLVADAIRLNRTDGAIVRIIAPVDPSGDETSAEALAMRFARVLIPLLPAYLPN